MATNTPGPTPSTDTRCSPARQAALFGLLGAALFAGKMAMAGLPNIEPVSLLVMLYAVCFGRRGLYAVCVYVLLEFAVWGVGLWSACYLYVWPLLFCLAGALRRSRHGEGYGACDDAESPLGWAALSGCFGLLFGALCAPVYWDAGGWASALSWWLSGLPFDILHGAGNFAMALVLFKPLRRWLDRLGQRYGFKDE